MIVKYSSEPWFSLIYCGKKTIEIALDKHPYHDLKPNDIIEFFNDDLGFNIRRKFCVEVLSIEEFDTWKLLLEKHLLHALPTIKSIEFADQILNQYFSLKDSQFNNYKKLAINIKRVSTLVNVSRTLSTAC